MTWFGFWTLSVSILYVWVASSISSLGASLAAPLKYGMHVYFCYDCMFSFSCKHSGNRDSWVDWVLTSFRWNRNGVSPRSSNCHWCQDTQAWLMKIITHRSIQLNICLVEYVFSILMMKHIPLIYCNIYLKISACQHWCDVFAIELTLDQYWPSTDPFDPFTVITSYTFSMSCSLVVLFSFKK